MIKIRNRSGKYIQFAEEDRPLLIEIVDEDDNVAMVFMEVSNNHIKHISAGDPEAKKYAETFGVSFISEVLQIPVKK